MKTPIALILFFFLVAAVTPSLSQDKNSQDQGFNNPFKSKTNDQQIQSGRSKTPELSLTIENGKFQKDISTLRLTKKQAEENLVSALALSAKNQFTHIKTLTHPTAGENNYFQQFYNGVKVEGAVSVVQSKGGQAKKTFGKVGEFNNFDTQAAISAEVAENIANRAIAAVDASHSEPSELLITKIPGQPQSYKLAYKVRADALNPVRMYHVYVDAKDGSIINKVTLIAHADGIASAQTLYSGTQEITHDSNGGSFRLRDGARKIETYNATNATFTNTNGFAGHTDFSNASTTWSSIPVLKTFVVSAVAQAWWFSALGDEKPELFIRVKDAANQVVYVSGFLDNTLPGLTFSGIDLQMLNPPYTVELLDKDTGDQDDLGGTYTITTTSGNWSGNGNNGSYTIASTNNPALDVHWGMEKTYDYYKNVHGRDSYDGNGSIIKNFVNGTVAVSNTQNNAFAFGPPMNVMVYGMGDGSFMKPLVGLDVEGHEFTHLVIDHNGHGGLRYQAESGALNESFADIFGTSIEFHTGINPDWLIGEDVMVTKPFMRSMSNPNAENQPDTYNGTFWASTADLESDEGGVHTNSGVQNFWFFLLSNGGTGTNDLGKSYSVTGIEITDASKIAYRNLTTYLTSLDSDYQDAFQGSILAAQDLFGVSSNQVAQVRAAWFAVGIGSDPSAFCSGTTELSTQTGDINDGSGLAQYQNNQNCSWKIQPVGAAQIRLTFAQFSTQQNFDFVKVYNGPDNTYSLLGSFSGATIPSAVTSTEGAMFIEFTTNASTTAAGWSASYTTIATSASSCSWGNVLTSATGTFSDGSVANNYGNNQQC